MMQRGYQQRLEKETNLTRHMMAYIKVFGGMGSSETVRVEDIWPLPMDTANVKLHITNVRQVKELVKEFEEALRVVRN